MAIQVSFGGQSWLTDDLTLDETIGIEKTTGMTWRDINPYRSAEAVKAILVAFLSRDMERDVAQSKIGALSLREVLDSIKVVTDDLPDEYLEGLPKAEGGPGTTGSSGDPASSDGPPT